MLTYNAIGNTRLRDQLNYLRLTRYERMHVNRALGRRVMSNSKKRMTKQTDLKGRKWEGRKTGKKTKMLRGLKKSMRVNRTADGATVRFVSGKVAYKHQHGWTETMTAKKLAEREKQRDPDEERSSGGMATRSQAKALLLLGYKRRNGKRYTKPTIMWIVNNLPMKQAGLLIRILKDEPSKQDWTIKTPQRSFLGVSEREQGELVEYLAEQITGRLNRRR